MHLSTTTGPRRARRVLIGAALACAVPLAGLGAAPAEAAKPRPSAAAETCLTGTLTYTFADAEGIASGARPVRNANWELVGVPAGGSGAAKTLSRGTTSGTDGAFSACAPYAGLAQASVRFTTASNDMWRVIASTNGSVHSTSSAVKQNVSGTVSLGPVAASASTAGGFKILDTLNKLYWKRGTTSPCWTENQSTVSACERLSVVWNNTTTDGGYWDDSNHNVYLAHDDPASQHLILHEAGHWFQWALYDGWFPAVSGCSPHYVDQASTTSCAWTEGFANAVAGYVLGDKRYVRPDGSQVAYQQADGSPWPGGDKTEGNVAAALIDLFRLDGPSGEWTANIHLFSVDASDDFREYFVADRPAYGLSTTGEAKAIINARGISY